MCVVVLLLIPFFEFICASDSMLYNEPLRDEFHRRLAKKNLFRTQTDRQMMKWNKSKSVVRIKISCWFIVSIDRLNKTFTEIALKPNKCLQTICRSFCCATFIAKWNQSSFFLGNRTSIFFHMQLKWNVLPHSVKCWIFTFLQLECRSNSDSN